jgi:hypothetical protein
MSDTQKFNIDQTTDETKDNSSVDYDKVCLKNRFKMSRFLVLYVLALRTCLAREGYGKK